MHFEFPRLPLEGATLAQQIDKVREEVQELAAAHKAASGASRQVIDEAFDVVQAALGVLQLVEGTADLSHSFLRHRQKLARRWTSTGNHKVSHG